MQSYIDYMNEISVDDELHGRIMEKAASARAVVEKRTHGKRIAGIIAAAALAIALSITAIANGDQLVLWVTGRTVWVDNAAKVRLKSHPISQEFRSYLDGREWEPYDGIPENYASSTNLSFQSLEDASAYFGFPYAHNALLTDYKNPEYDGRTGNVLTHVAYSPTKDDGGVFLLIWYDLSNGPLGAEQILFCDIEVNFAEGYAVPQEFSVTISDATEMCDYASPVNGIEAALYKSQTDSYYSHCRYGAVFAVNDARYSLSMSSLSIGGVPDISDTDVSDAEEYYDILKAIIDAFE